MNPVTSSGDLVRQAQTGDHRAFAALVEDCDELMRRLAYGLLGSQAAMDDALQDAYLKAYRKLGQYDGRSAFSTWIYTIVYRTCLEHARSRSRRAETTLDAVPEAVSETADHTERQADADVLQRALHDLPTDQAAAVVLVDGDGCSYQQAATILGVPEGTIASRLNRAHQTLRAALQPGIGEMRGS